MEKITPITGQALRRVFMLLETNFDVEKGHYVEGYNDVRVAKETGISEGAVKEYRVSAFGKLRPPSELTTVAQQLKELEDLYIKMDAEFKTSMKDCKLRIAQLQRKFD